MDKSPSVPVFDPKQNGHQPVASPAQSAHLSFPTGCNEANRTIKAAIDLSASRWGPWGNPLGVHDV